MMYIGTIETRSLKILSKSFHENYSNLFKKQHGTMSVLANYGENRTNILLLLQKEGRGCISHS